MKRVSVRYATGINFPKNVFDFGDKKIMKVYDKITRMFLNKSDAYSYLLTTRSAF